MRGSGFDSDTGDKLTIKLLSGMTVEIEFMDEDETPEGRLRARSDALEQRARQRRAFADHLFDLKREFNLFRYRRLARHPEVPLPPLAGTKLAAAISVARRNRRGTGRGSEGGGHWRLSSIGVYYGRGVSSDGFYT